MGSKDLSASSSSPVSGLSPVHVPSKGRKGKEDAIIAYSLIAIHQLFNQTVI